MVNNNTGSGEVGLAALIKAGRVAKMICSYPRTTNSTVFPELYRSGRIELELVPQGTLAERIRAGGAGIPAFFTATAVGTDLAEGKEHHEFEGRTYLMERGLTADYALIKCREADPYGNLVYNKTARNFSPVMATAATTTIVQAKRIVAVGSLDPEAIVTPGIFAQRIVEVPETAAGIGPRRERGSLPMSTGLTREQMAQRAALDIENGSYVNLGIGIPELVAQYVPDGRQVIYHTENGLLGMGAEPEEAGDPS